MTEIKLTSQAEQERMENARRLHKSKWELLTTFSLVQAVRYARDHGWAEKKVQVRARRVNSKEIEYTVEPFERDCRCPNLLRYEDYF